MQLTCEDLVHAIEMKESAHLQRLEGHEAEVTAAAGGALLGEMHISNLPQHVGRSICTLQAALHSSHRPAPSNVRLRQSSLVWTIPGCSSKCWKLCCTQSRDPGCGSADAWDGDAHGVRSATHHAPATKVIPDHGHCDQVRHPAYIDAGPLSESPARGCCSGRQRAGGAAAAGQPNLRCEC